MARFIPTIRGPRQSGPSRWPRRVRQFILVFLLALAAACAGLVWGAWSSGRDIDAHTGNAVAEVRSVSIVRTTVDFVDETGEYRSPPVGVLFPVGLEPGQRVRVEYDQTNPDLVRVQGRGWTLAILPAVSVLLGGFILAAPVWWFSVRATRRSLTDSVADTER